MKKLIASLCLCCSFAAIGASEDDNAKYGGYLKIWPSNHGTLVFVNAQKAVSAEALKKPIDKIIADFAIDVRLQDGTLPAIKDIKGELAKLKAIGAIWIINDEAYPLVLSACENGWAILNVAPLLADKKDDTTLSRRLQREIYRVFGFTHGGYETEMMPQCVLKQANSVAGIDALICNDYSPAAFMKISKYLGLMGYARCKRGTYYDACEEGWAPLPTNDVQKAIWDKVHQMPTKPIKITPESKRIKRTK